MLHDGSAVIGWFGTAGESWSFLTAPGGGALTGTYTNPASTTYVPLIDAEGSTIALVNTAQPGVPSSTFTYDPYGMPKLGGNGTSWPFGYHGLETESTDPANLYFDPSGNVYNPQIQRFLSEVGQQGLGGPGAGQSVGTVSPPTVSTGGLSFSSYVKDVEHAGQTAGDVFNVASQRGGEDTADIVPAVAAAAAYVVDFLVNFFEDIFGGGSETVIPRQLKYGRHIIYPWQGFSRSRIVTMGSAFRGSIVRVQAAVPPPRPLANSPTPGLGHIPGYNRPLPFSQACGPGSFGGTPSDPTENCCMVHDNCYAKHGLSSGDVNILHPGLGAGAAQRECDQALCACVGNARSLGPIEHLYQGGMGWLFCYNGEWP